MEKYCRNNKTLRKIMNLKEIFILFKNYLFKKNVAS